MSVFDGNDAAVESRFPCLTPLLCLASYRGMEARRSQEDVVPSLRNLQLSCSTRPAEGEAVQLCGLDGRILPEGPGFLPQLQPYEDLLRFE